MYQVKVISGFSSAHSLRHYKGKCESLHGHNWKVEAVVSSNQLDECGMVMDFNVLKSNLKEIMEELDHKHLNDLDYFKTANPSSEEIARYIFNKLKTRIVLLGSKLQEIRVHETEASCAIYSE